MSHSKVFSSIYIAKSIICILVFNLIICNIQFIKAVNYNFILLNPLYLRPLYLIRYCQRHINKFILYFRLSTTSGLSDSMSVSHRLNDVQDVQDVARMQEESKFFFFKEDYSDSRTNSTLFYTRNSFHYLNECF